MKKEHQSVGQTISAAVTVMLSVYKDSYLLLDRLGSRVKSLDSSSGTHLIPVPWLMFEPQGADDPLTYVRARLALFFLAEGALSLSDENADCHMRLAKDESLVAAVIQFHWRGKAATPYLYIGRVGSFSGRFLKDDSVHIHRGDLAALLDSADYAAGGSKQVVYGRTRDRKASLFLKPWAPLAAVESGEDIEALAKDLVALYSGKDSVEAHVQ